MQQHRIKIAERGKRKAVAVDGREGERAAAEGRHAAAEKTPAGERRDRRKLEAGMVLRLERPGVAYSAWYFR